MFELLGTTGAITNISLDNIYYTGGGAPITSGNVSPTITLTAPANNANFTAPAAVVITATAADSDGTVSKVEFYNGTTLLGTSTTSPYTYTWNNVVAGTYSITAKATDNASAATTSTAKKINMAMPSRYLQPGQFQVQEIQYLQRDY